LLSKILSQERKKKKILWCFVPETQILMIQIMRFSIIINWESGFENESFQ